MIEEMEKNGDGISVGGILSMSKPKAKVEQNGFIATPLLAQPFRWLCQRSLRAFFQATDSSSKDSVEMTTSIKHSSSPGMGPCKSDATPPNDIYVETVLHEAPELEGKTASIDDWQLFRMPLNPEHLYLPRA
jgi:hypothetical protein